ncbi:MAG: HD domain-containing phosphohydrolase [Sporomusaceae bacterium]|nr:HD domain-containing phosphohydrolase [Sporomusaceae bacterium]
MLLEQSYREALKQCEIDLGAEPARLHSEMQRQTVEAAVTAFTSAAAGRKYAHEFGQLAGICLKLLLNAGIANLLAQLRSHSGYTFLHSLNVAVISGLIGHELGISGDRLNSLVLSGLLHDIGKQHVPLAILNKRDRLDPVELAVIRRHAACGYEMLKELPHISLEARRGVLQHHERLDGSGYPLGLPKNKIALFARIIAIADSYDAMTGGRTYRSRLTPYMAIEAITAEMRHRLDKNIGSIFLAKLRDYSSARPNLFYQQAPTVKLVADLHPRKEAGPAIP